MTYLTKKCFICNFTSVVKNIIVRTHGQSICYVVVCTCDHRLNQGSYWKKKFGKWPLITLRLSPPRSPWEKNAHIKNASLSLDFPTRAKLDSAAEISRLMHCGQIFGKVFCLITCSTFPRWNEVCKFVVYWFLAFNECFLKFVFVSRVGMSQSLSLNVKTYF